MRERQESLLLEKLPKEITKPEEVAKLVGVVADDVLLMKSRIGESTGRAVVLAGPQTVLTVSGDVQVRPLDRADTALFVEQCQRYIEFTDDVRRLASAASIDGFNRIVTLTGVPKSYTRRDVMDSVSDATEKSVSVESPRDVVFRFKKNGYQSDTASVLLKSADDAHKVIKAVQEYGVPQRRVYGTSFGCSFVYADRSSLFISDPSLDFALDSSKYWVMSLGWNPELDETQMRGVLDKLAIYPNKIVKVNGGVGGEFLLRFDRMKNTKLVFSRLQRLKRRWRIGSNVPFFAYPVRADLHFEHDTVHADEESDCDDDLDEPVMY